MSEIESINEIESDLFRAEEVDRFADPKEARKKAMDYLARREYGQRELEQKLIVAGFESATVIDTVHKLAEEGLQDDRRFVESFTQSRIGKGKGPVRIRQEVGPWSPLHVESEDVVPQLHQGWPLPGVTAAVQEGAGPGLGLDAARESQVQSGAA